MILGACRTKVKRKSVQIDPARLVPSTTYTPYPTFAPWQDLHPPAGSPRAQFLRTRWRHDHPNRIALARHPPAPPIFRRSPATSRSTSPSSAAAFPASPPPCCWPAPADAWSLLERDQIASGETGNTTSHLTEAVDARYQTLIKDFGEEGARWSRSRAATRSRGSRRSRAPPPIDCGFERVPGYLYTERASDVEQLANELDAARRAGCAVQWTDHVPLPFPTEGGVYWEDQAQVHATAYLDALLDAACAGGVAVLREHPCRRRPRGRAVPRRDRSRHASAPHHVFVAANVPVNNRVLLHTKIAAYRSYAIAADVPPAFPTGLFWDTDDPYHYTRKQLVNGRTYLIVGGEDHRTGMKTDTDDVLRAPARLRAEALLGSTAGATAGRGRSSSRWTGCRSSAATPRRSTSTWPPGTRATA